MPATLTGDLATLLSGAAFAPLADRAFLRITGPDATRWLNGMVTNSIQGLNPGEGNYNFFLNAQGRIQGDATIYRSGSKDTPVYILETESAQLAPIHQLLDRFIIMDDVELTPMDTYTYGLHLYGPGTQAILGNLSQMPVGTLADTGPFRFKDLPGSADFATTSAPGLVPHLYLASETPIRSMLEDLRMAHAVEATPALREALRVLEARPCYGTDIRNTDTAKDLPQETNQAHALHFAKGCYLGQEIVERIRSRGQVHRLFTPFRLQGSLPENLPAPLTVNGKPAGELTSATVLATADGPVHLALGYARREFLETQAAFTYAGGTALPRHPGQLT